MWSRAYRTWPYFSKPEVPIAQGSPWRGEQVGPHWPLQSNYHDRFHWFKASTIFAWFHPTFIPPVSPSSSDVLDCDDLDFLEDPNPLSMQHCPLLLTGSSKQGSLSKAFPLQTAFANQTNIQMEWTEAYNQGVLSRGLQAVFVPRLYTYV